MVQSMGMNRVLESAHGTTTTKPVKHWSSLTFESHVMRTMRTPPRPKDPPFASTALRLRMGRHRHSFAGRHVTMPRACSPNAGAGASFPRACPPSTRGWLGRRERGWPQRRKGDRSFVRLAPFAGSSRADRSGAQRSPKTARLSGMRRLIMWGAGIQSMCRTCDAPTS